MPKQRLEIQGMLNTVNIECGDDVFELKGDEPFCKLCHVKLVAGKPSKLRQHLKCNKHKLAVDRKQQYDPGQINEISEKMFNEDLCEALLAAKIPMNKLHNGKLRTFLEKYSGRRIPTETSLRKNYVPRLCGGRINKKPSKVRIGKTKQSLRTKRRTTYTEHTTDSDISQGDLDLSDSGAPSVDGNEASDGAGPSEGNDEGSSFSREDFETFDVSDVKVKVEQLDDFCSEPETKRSRVENYQEDSKMEEALSILRDLKQSYSASQEPNDRFTLYGQHVASKLRGYSEKTSAIVEHAINNILFEADMGNYDGIHTALPSHDDSAQ